MTNLFLSFNLSGSVRCCPVRTALTPVWEQSFRPLWSRQNRDRSTAVRVFEQFFCAGKMIMLTFRLFYEKMKIVFLVKYRHKVRKIISQGIDIDTILMSSMQYY